MDAESRSKLKAGRKGEGRDVRVRWAERQNSKGQTCNGKSGTVMLFGQNRRVDVKVEGQRGQKGTQMRITQ